MTKPFNATRIRSVLKLDAVTCLAAGALMTFAAQPLGGATDLHPDLLRAAGIALFPVAALFFTMSRMAAPARGLVQLAVIGNLLWVAGSIAVLAYAGANLFGVLFVAGQALAVLVLAVLEARDAFTAPLPAIQ